MTINPDGLPPWGHTTDFSFYGGHASKVNYQSQGAINARTDVSAEEFIRMVADLSAAVRTAPFAHGELVMNGAGNPTVNFIEMMTGRRTTSYGGLTPPTGFPSAQTIGTGVADLVFSGSYADEFGASTPFAPLDALANAQTDQAHFANAIAFPLSGIVRLRYFNATGVATDGTVAFWVW